jgi:hypothetical protein
MPDNFDFFGNIKFILIFIAVCNNLIIFVVYTAYRAYVISRFYPTIVPLSFLFRSHYNCSATTYYGSFTNLKSVIFHFSNYCIESVF